MEKISFKKFFKHLNTVRKHRSIVFGLCVKCGLFWRGLVHDLSKYSPTEFWEGVRYYSGNHSPISECRKQTGHSLAWLHHTAHNKHHFEYWFDRGNVEQMDIPYKYAVESVCDRISASMCYNGKNYTNQKVLDYWQKDKAKEQLNDRMKAFYDKVFSDLAEHGSKYILNKKYMKQTYNKIVKQCDTIK